jgi:UDP-N-acetylmuramoyl-L-alanyl-D-glutamate--2,6-diaminopimelate ligase
MIIDGLNIKGVTCNSRKVKEGYVFVALKGEKTDGNYYIDEAIERGASLIFTEEEVTEKKVKMKKVSNARKVLAELCNEFYNYPSEKLKVIGITGTNGKTTTGFITYKILSDFGISTGLIGTLNVFINDKKYKSRLTTPDAEDIYEYLAEMVKEKVKVVVMEVSSHGLKNERVHGIKFDIAVHTNIEKDHLNFHKTIHDYIASKKKIFDNLSEGKIALINIDDENGIKLLTENKNIIVITYGLNFRSTITASSINTEPVIKFTYCLQRGVTTLSGIIIDPFEYPFILNILGRHNIYNGLAAITCCLLLDIPMKNIAKSLEEFYGIPRRMEIVYKGEYVVIDDFCHNPASYETVFQSIQSLQYKSVSIVNAIRGNRGREINIECAEVIKRWVSILNAKSLIITASTDYADFSNKVNKEEKEAFFNELKKDNIVFQYEENLYDAIKKAVENLERGDILLLMGAQGMDHGSEIFLKLSENVSF